LTPPRFDNTSPQPFYRGKLYYSARLSSTIYQVSTPYILNGIAQKLSLAKPKLDTFQIPRHTTLKSFVS